MALAKVRIEPERVSQKAEISLENTTGFTVENQGNTSVWLSFKDAATGRVIEVQPGSDRLFAGTPGAVFSGAVICEFDATAVPAGVTPVNLCLVVKQMITTNC